MRRLSALALLALLAGCAQPFEGRVAAKLSDAGLPRPMAECMAKRWVDRLNVFQLRKISGLADHLKKERPLTAARLVRRVAEVDDPEIYKVVSSSAAICALKL